MELRRQNRESQLYAKRNLYNEDFIREDVEDADTEGQAEMDLAESNYQDPHRLEHKEIESILDSILSSSEQQDVVGTMARVLPLIDWADEAVKLDCIRMLRVVSTEVGAARALDLMAKSDVLPELVQLIYMGSHEIQVSVTELFRDLVAGGGREQLETFSATGALSALAIMLTCKNNEAVYATLQIFGRFAQERSLGGNILEAVMGPHPNFREDVEKLYGIENDAISRAAFGLLDAVDQYENGDMAMMGDRKSVV